MGRSLSAPTLADPLVSLRPWRRGDAEALELACGDQDICRFTTVPDRYTREEAEAWIARQHQRLAAGGAIVLAIVPADSENPVGMVGLFGLDEGTRSARFGYWLIRSFRGRALANAATRLLGRWACQELDVDALLLDVEPDNRASQRIAEALGAQYVGEVEQQHASETVTLMRYSVPCARTLQSRRGVGASDVPGCLACDLASGRRPLPGGVIHASEHWYVEHCVGPLGVGTLLIKPKRHTTRVSELSETEAAELGPLLQRSAAVVDELLSPEQVYVCLWSHAGGQPVHIHYVVQPVMSSQMAQYEAYGPRLQVAMFDEGDPPPTTEVEEFADRARHVFFG